MDDDALIAMATTELRATGLVTDAAVIDGCVVRAPRAYPVYNSGYDQHLATLVAFVEAHKNLHPMGRYGMFKYNNSDHSILTALLSVENILGAKHSVWSVNTETEYHEVR
jgi:protoporphyrinogen oxidase